MKSQIANVVDLELSCYPGDLFPEGERKEIIEVGLTTVDLRALAILKTYSFPVIPTMSRISPYCTELTGWTEKKLLRQGMPFARVMKLLAEKHGAKNRVLVSDHSGEAAAMAAQCESMGIECPLGDEQHNVSTVIAIVTGNLENLSLDEKLALFGLQFEGDRHRGANDSYNIARLLVATYASMRERDFGRQAKA